MGTVAVVVVSHCNGSVTGMAVLRHSPSDGPGLDWASVASVPTIGLAGSCGCDDPS